ncbi:5-bromo-4-chloroindolyl phosphate hydrolysis family protein [uncultured Selenomonas sp.]|uniref:5-bromo-4-chloroindolyl phosphate hydrolysis family protein n=1 Tax=uncultured Selenomonas sp. TaxID=159275 RepID=UPI0026260F5B|nr:5-bromo-4-chloroindolyl phosphate hydrolysis family protein [uncultured Selenomonas sp.]
MRYLWLVFAIAALGGGAWLGYEGELWKAGVTLFFGGFALLQTRGLRGGKQRLRLKRAQLQKLPDARAELLEASFAKAADDYDALQNLHPAIKDREMSQELVALQHVAGNMLRYLERNPERIAAAEDFIEIYQEKAAVLLRQYVELEETQIASDEVVQAKARVKEMLSSLRTTYEEEFKRVLNYQIMDLNAEIEVLQHSMKGQTEGAACAVPEATEHPFAGRGAQRPMQAANATPVFLQKVSSLARGSSVIPQELYWQVVRRKIKASLLGIFLGGFGAHKFFLGKNFQGVGYILFLWTGLPIFVGFIEGVRWLFMPVDDFYFDYCDED